MAGLSSTENLAAASTSLRRTAKDSSGVSTEIKDFGGFLPVMLLQIKGLCQITSTKGYCLHQKLLVIQRAEDWVVG